MNEISPFNDESVYLSIYDNLLSSLPDPYKRAFFLSLIYVSLCFNGARFSTSFLFILSELSMAQIK
jgi:hypothetical protein